MPNRIKRRIDIRKPGEVIRPQDVLRDRQAFVNPDIGSTQPARHALSHLPLGGSDPLSYDTPLSIGLNNADGTADSFALSEHIHRAMIPGVAGEPTSTEEGQLIYDTVASLVKRRTSSAWLKLGPLTVKELDGSPSVTGVTTIQVNNGYLTDNGSGSVTITVPPVSAAGTTGSVQFKHSGGGLNSGAIMYDESASISQLTIGLTNTTGETLIGQRIELYGGGVTRDTYGSVRSEDGSPLDKLRWGTSKNYLPNTVQTGVYAGYHAFVGTLSTTPFQIRTNDTGRITILADGKVGIGTGTYVPTQTFDVESASIKLGTAAQGGYLFATAGVISWISAASTGFVPYTGATSNVDLGIRSLTAAALISPSLTYAGKLTLSGSTVSMELASSSSMLAKIIPTATTPTGLQYFSIDNTGHEYVGVAGTSSAVYGIYLVPTAVGDRTANMTVTAALIQASGNSNFTSTLGTPGITIRGVDLIAAHGSTGHTNTAPLAVDMNGAQFAVSDGGTYLGSGAYTLSAIGGTFSVGASATVDIGANTLTATYIGGNFILAQNYPGAWSSGTINMTTIGVNIGGDIYHDDLLGSTLTKGININLSAQAALTALTDDMYGIYIEGLVGGANIRYAYYNTTDAPNLMGIDNSITYWGTGNDLQIYFDGTSGYIIATGAALVLSSTTVERIIVAGGSDFTPETDNTGRLGTAAYRWSYAHVVNIADLDSISTNSTYITIPSLLLGSLSKYYLRDTAIGIWSQADSFMDLFADGAVRIGNSSAGAPTTYLSIEPDGDTFWTGDGAGLPYGSFYGNEISFAAAVNNTYAIIADTDCVSGEVNEVTYTDAGTTLTIGKAGRYLIVWSVAAESGTANTHVLGGIMVDSTSTLQAAGRCHFEAAAANRQVAISGTAILDLAAGAVVGVGIGSEDNITITVDHVNLSVVMVGGT